MNDREWLNEKYDEIVRNAASEGLTVAEIRELWEEAYEQAVEAGEVQREEPATLREEARRLFDANVMKERERRRGAFMKDAAWLIAALNGETVLGRDDPILERAFLLGDGRDKTLRFWTVEDWNTAIQMRYRHAADASAAAREFDVEFASCFIQDLRRRNADYTGQLFERESGEAA